jgi:hypothetical protein
VLAFLVSPGCVCRRGRTTRTDHADEPLARAEANGYKSGAQKEPDGVRGRGKHEKKTMKDKNANLKRYGLWEKTIFPDPHCALY